MPARPKKPSASAGTLSAAAARRIAAAVATQHIDDLKAALARQAGAPPGQALMNAGRLAWLPGLKLLARAGGDLNASYKNYRPLHALLQEKPHAGSAATPQRVACLKWLLAHGADPELPAAWPSARALIVAAFVGERAFVDALVEAGARQDIFTAAALGDAPRVGRLLAADASLATARDGGLLTALQCCGGSRLGAHDTRVAAGLLACARQLIDAGADVNATTPSWGHDVSVSYFVIRSHQRAMLELLLARGLDPTAAVATAAWENQGDVLDVLIAHGADVNRAVEHGRPVLNELIRWGQFTQARLLLARGADPNLPDDRGWTAMHQVVSRGNLKMLKDLVAAGGDPNRADNDGRTPRGTAKRMGRVDLIAAMGLRDL